RSGDYHYLLNNKPVSKTSLIEGLSKIGLNPDNMLVIMHQLMVGRFGTVSPIEKLLLLEDAVGFVAYRKEVLEASDRLQKLSSELDRVSQELETFREEHLKLEHSRGFRSGSLEWIARFRNLVTPGAEQNDQLRQTLAELNQEHEKISNTAILDETEYTRVRSKIAELSGHLTKSTDLLVESKVKSEVNSFKLSMMAQEVQELEVQLRLGEEELAPLRTQAL